MKTPKSQYRFFVPTESISGDDVSLPSPVVRQMRDVLRMKAGDRVVLLDGTGVELVSSLVELGRAGRAHVVERRQNSAEPAVQVCLFQAALKAKKMETVWQKATELGAAALIPVMCERSVGGKPSDPRSRRLSDIVREAAEQSGRGRLPRLGDSLGFEQALGTGGALKLIFSAGESRPADEVPRGDPVGGVSILIGPEGGFSPRELGLAGDAGWTRVSLGPLTLRAETAAVVAVALVTHQLSALAGAT